MMANSTWQMAEGAGARAEKRRREEETMSSETNPQTDGTPAVHSSGWLGLRFIGRHSRWKAEWEIFCEPMQDAFGRLFVWAGPVRRLSGQGKMKAAYVWHLADLPDGVRPNERGQR